MDFSIKAHAGAPSNGVYERISSMILDRRSFCALPAVALAPAEVRLPKVIRVGILGLVGHVEDLLEPLGELPEVHVVAMAESDAALLQTFASRPALRAAKTYSDARRLLDNEKLDVAVICNANGDRAAAIVDCASRKIHVIAEKPIALSATELAGVRSAVTSGGIRLCSLLRLRFEAHYQAMKELVQQGLVGEVIQIEAQKSYRIDGWPGWKSHESSYGGTIPWIGVDLIDLMSWVSGRSYTHVASLQTHIGFSELGEMQNSAAGLFRLDNGGMAVMRLDYLRPTEAPTHGDDRLRVAGTKGIIEYQAATGLTVMERGKAPRRANVSTTQGSIFKDFVISVYAGSGAFPIPETEIYRTMDVTLRAWDAASGFTWVAV
jgi:predicted dehydrogenase